MSIKVNIEINVAAEGYTEHESAILAALAAHPSQGSAAVIPAAEKPAVRVLTNEKSEAGHTKEAADARIAEAKAKAAEEAKAKAAADAKAKAAAAAKAKADADAAAAAAATAEAAAAEPAEEPAEDLLGGTEYTLKDAIAKATELVSNGRGAEVKAALAPTGAKKVSELKGDAIATFIQALEV